VGAGCAMRSHYADGSMGPGIRFDPGNWTVASSVGPHALATGETVSARLGVDALAVLTNRTAASGVVLPSIAGAIPNCGSWRGHEELLHLLRFRPPSKQVYRVACLYIHRWA